jgi:hypothetical protein
MGESSWNGATRRETALAGAITRLSKSTQTIGSPSPVTPSAKPVAGRLGRDEERD